MEAQRAKQTTVCAALLRSALPFRIMYFTNSHPDGQFNYSTCVASIGSTESAQRHEFRHHQVHLTCFLGCSRAHSHPFRRACRWSFELTSRELSVTGYSILVESEHWPCFFSKPLTPAPTSPPAANCLCLDHVFFRPTLAAMVSAFAGSAPNGLEVLWNIHVVGVCWLLSW